MEALKSNGLVVKISSSLAFEGFFSEHTEEEVNTYNHDALGALSSAVIVLEKVCCTWHVGGALSMLRPSSSKRPG
jgi:hypothetical protein